jgi:hypothetical protein
VNSEEVLNHLRKTERWIPALKGAHAAIRGFDGISGDGPLKDDELVWLVAETLPELLGDETFFKNKAIISPVKPPIEPLPKNAGELLMRVLRELSKCALMLAEKDGFDLVSRAREWDALKYALETEAWKDESKGKKVYDRRYKASSPEYFPNPLFSWHSGAKNNELMRAVGGKYKKQVSRFLKEKYPKKKRLTGVQWESADILECLAHTVTLMKDHTPFLIGLLQCYESDYKLLSWDNRLDVWVSHKGKVFLAVQFALQKIKKPADHFQTPDGQAPKVKLLTTELVEIAKALGSPYVDMLYPLGIAR